jgi:hypothetical protein
MYQDVRLKYFINSLNYVKTFEIESYTPWLDYEILDFVSRLPVRYRLDKKLYRQTIVEMFPTLFEHVAQTRNDIDWATSFRDSPKLCHLIYRELIEDQSILSEFVDIEKLKDELDGFFAPSPVETNRRRTWKAATTRLRRFSPAAFNFLYRSSYYARKWMGKYRESLPTERLIIRLLILKVWGDVFLNYPVAKKSG